MNPINFFFEPITHLYSTYNGVTTTNPIVTGVSYGLLLLRFALSFTALYSLTGFLDWAWNRTARIVLSVIAYFAIVAIYANWIKKTLNRILQSVGFTWNIFSRYLSGIHSTVGITSVTFGSSHPNQMLFLEVIALAIIASYIVHRYRGNYGESVRFFGYLTGITLFVFAFAQLIDIQIFPIPRAYALVTNVIALFAVAYVSVVVVSKIGRRYLESIGSYTPRPAPCLAYIFGATLLLLSFVVYRPKAAILIWILDIVFIESSHWSLYNMLRGRHPSTRKIQTTEAGVDVTTEETEWK